MLKSVFVYKNNSDLEEWRGEISGCMICYQVSLNIFIFRTCNHYKEEIRENNFSKCN